MKKAFLTFLMALNATLAMAATNPVPIQVEPSGDSNHIPVALAPVLAVPAPSEPAIVSWVTNTGIVYLDDRTDGVDGDGTLANPYDASTPEKLKAVWPKVGNQFVLLPGRYLMADRLSWSGKSVSAYGATLQYSNNVRGGYIGYSPKRIEGLDLDFGLCTNVNAIAQGFLLTGGSTIKDTTLRRLRGNFSRGAEAFGLVLFGEHNVVEGCNFLQAQIWESTYMNAIAVGSGYGHQILRNYIDLDPYNSPTNATYGLGTSASGCIVAYNIVKNVRNAVHMDTSGANPPSGWWENNLYIGNQFTANMRVIRIDATTQKYRNFSFVGNMVASGHTGDHYGRARSNWPCDTLVFLQCTQQGGIRDFFLSGNYFIEGGKKDGDASPFIVRPQVENVMWGLNYTNRMAP